MRPPSCAFNYGATRSRRKVLAPLPTGRPPSSRRFRKVCTVVFPWHRVETQDPSERSRTCLEGPFGEVVRATGPMAKANPFRFSTKYQDDETDLLYYGYRYYSASMGRWNSRDPLAEVGGRNIYCFVANAPVISFDKDGRLTIQFAFGAGTACGGWNAYWKIWTDLPGAEYWLVQEVTETAVFQNCCDGKQQKWQDHYFEAVKLQERLDGKGWPGADSQSGYPATLGKGQKVEVSAKLFTPSPALDSLISEWGYQSRPSTMPDRHMVSTCTEPPFWNNPGMWGSAEVGSAKRKSWKDAWNCCNGRNERSGFQHDP